MQISGRRTGLTCRQAPFKGAASGAEVAREGGAHCCAEYLRGPEASRVPHSVLILTLLPKQMAFCIALVFGMPAWHSSEPSEQP